jgi:hypothetical protein
MLTLASCGKLLRHSREMTMLCSPKVTHHHGQLGGVLPPGKSFLAARQELCGVGPAAPGGRIASPPQPVLSAYFVAQDSFRAGKVRRERHGYW